MGMGATASGPTGSPDEYVVTYCRVRARDVPALLSSPPRWAPPRWPSPPPPRAARHHLARLAETTSADHASPQPPFLRAQN